MTEIVGVDVGGTFTDLVLIDDESGRVRIAKVATSADNQAIGVLTALDTVGANLATVASIVHGTTITTNALLERKISRCGLVTTKGFRDVLELGRRTRPTPYGLTGHFEPLIPRERRLAVTERMDADGEVVTPLDEAEVVSAVAQLLALGCESLVIHFLHSYINPRHELRAAELARTVWPNDYVTVGHAISGEYREYERGTTAAVNAAVQPVLHRYLFRLGEELRTRGYASDLLVMQGNGGIVSSRIAAEDAVRTVLSGPASGVMAAAYIATAAGFANVITCDMGGTSCDVSLIRGGLPNVSSELELEYGMPIHVPMLDVRSIGAGGGSVAFVNDAGMLQVGPRSAGANPGPVCYGHGGDEPTITDANLVLGRLDSQTLLTGGETVSMDHVRGGHPTRCWGAPGNDGGGGGGGDPAGGQRPHGRSLTHGLVGARPRSTGLCSLRFRRRRSPACGGPGTRSRRSRRDRAGPTRHDQRHRVRRRRRAARLRDFTEPSGGRPGHDPRPEILEYWKSTSKKVNAPWSGSGSRSSISVFTIRRTCSSSDKPTSSPFRFGGWM